MNFLIKFATLSFLVAVANGNSFNYGFERCRVTCSDSGEDFVNLVSNRPVAMGKQGPAGSPGIQGPKGEPGKVDDELMRKLVGVSRKNEKLEAEVEKHKKFFSTPYMRIKVCGSGVQDRSVVKDSQITAVSYWNNLPHYYSYYGRLFNTGPHGGSWIAGRPALDQNNKEERWIEVNYEQEKTIYAVVTQGRNTGGNYVSSYNVLYKTGDDNEFKYILDESGEAKIFPGNFDMQTPVINNFPEPITAQYFRINAVSWNALIALRFDFLQCET